MLMNYKPHYGLPHDMIDNSVNPFFLFASYLDATAQFLWR